MNKISDYELQFPTIENSFEIMSDLEGELQKELLPIFAKAKRICLKRLHDLADLPVGTTLNSIEAQTIIDDAINQFRVYWNKTALPVLNRYSNASFNLGEITAEVIFANIAAQEGR